jgi:hypothetical protein
MGSFSEFLARAKSNVEAMALSSCGSLRMERVVVQMMVLISLEK